MATPRILIVDTDHQVSNTLRSSLLLSGQRTIIIEAPSGEEALLEVTRGGIDLLVTDLSLPGMSGLELLERVRKVNPEARAIVVTGRPTEEARRRAAELGVIAFLNKPIRTSHFLEAVSRGLSLASRNGAEAAESEREFVAEWLMAMQRELGAEATFLLDQRGGIVVEAGQIDAVDLRSAIPALISARTAGQKISELLKSKAPTNFMYFDGERYDVYLTSAGTEHALVIVFEAMKGAKQIGAVLQYSRQAASDLVSGLYSVGEVDVKASRGGGPNDKKRAEPPKETPGKELASPDLESAAGKVNKKEAEKYWDEASGKTGDTGPIDESTLSYDEARRRGLLPKTSEE
ncbi:MAG: response regulator transcription factor [Anaerolineales bacterium]